MELITKYKFVIIGGIIIVITILIVLTNFIANNINNNGSNQSDSDNNSGINPTITRVPLNTLKTVNSVPTLPPAKGEGIDITSQEVQDSISAIERLSTSLPYKKKLVSSQGVPVEILIPPPHLLENEWTLTIHIFGPEYQLPENDPDYNKMRNAFLDGAADAILFLESRGIDTNDVIVQWGDRVFIQERSVEWLEE